MALKSLEDFVEEVGCYETRFERVRHLSKDEPERLKCMAEIESWLHDCIAHGRYMPHRSPDRRVLQGLVDFWITVLRQSGHDVAEIRRLVPFDQSAGVPLDAACPYPGLNALGRDKATEFFGREKTIQDCLEHFKSHRILLILGGSGSGKSSLAMAGVLPALEQEPSHSTWKFIPTFTPGAEPFVSLGRALAMALGNESRADEISDHLGQEPQRASGILNELFGGVPVMLFIDQFEELLTLCQNAEQQKAFATLLCTLAAESDEAATEDASSIFLCRTLMTLRTDHFARFENNALLRPLYQLLIEKHNTQSLGGIDFESIRRAIEVPAKRVGLRFLPPDTIDTLASQTASLANGLPLLQFALWRLWGERPKDKQGRSLDFINKESLRALPDVQNALGKVAEEAFRTLDGEKQSEKKQLTENQYGKKQNLCKRLMLELVVLDENFEEPLRRRRPIAELRRILTRFWPEDAVEQVINAFQDKGLLHLSGLGEAGQIEVAHEAMFRNWSTFREWINGDDAKKRLHTLKLISREAADWREHLNSTDSTAYLKQTGEPLQSALRYAAECWLVDPDVGDYLDACQQYEKKKAEQQRQFDREKERTQQAEMDLARAEVQQAKTKNKLLKAYMGFGLLLIICVGILGYQYTKDKQSKDTLRNALPLLMGSLSPWEALDVAQSVAKKGGEDFRYFLAHSLERMDGTQLLGAPSTPRNSDVFFGDQGAAVFQFDTSHTGDPKLKVYRVCDTGEVDRAPAEISLVQHNAPAEISRVQHNLREVAIGPPDPSPGHNRIIVVVRKADDNDKTLELKAYSLSWSGSSPCKAEEPGQPSLAVSTQLLAEPIEDVDSISPIAFDSDGQSAVFSALQYEPSKLPKSTLWQLFKQNSGDWKLKELRSADTSPSDDESVVTAVAFRGGHGSEPVEERLITGRLNGAIYCGSKPLTPHTNPDTSAVEQISSRRGSGNSDWFAYRQASGRVSAWKCEHGRESPFTLKEPAATSTANGSFVNLNYDGHEKPLVTYVDGKQWKCWVNASSDNKNTWQESECQSAYSVNQIAISRDARHVVTIEEAGLAAVHWFPLRFLTDREKVGGRLAVDKLILWNTRDTSEDKTTWEKLRDAYGFERFESLSPRGVEIRGAALSPSGKQLVWVELVSQSDNSKYEVSLFETSTQEYTRNVWQKSSLNALAVNDSGIMAIATGDSLWLRPSEKRENPSGAKQNDTSQPENFPKIEIPDIDIKDELIVCLGFSPDNHNLVIGTQAGRLWLRKNRELSKTQTLQRDQTSPPPSVTACAVSNDGTIVGGFKDGSVWIFKPEPNPQQVQNSKPIQLSPRVIYQFAVPVKAVSLEEGPKGQPHHVAVLSEWQLKGCTRPGLPGQSVQIWDLQHVLSLKSEDELPPPVSIRCFPNQRVTTIGSVRQSDSGGNITVQLPVVFGKEVQLLPCRGCIRNNETPKQMLNRLLNEAKQLGAQEIDDTKLDRSYGISLGFDPLRKISSFVSKYSNMIRQSKGHAGSAVLPPGLHQS